MPPPRSRSGDTTDRQLTGADLADPPEEAIAKTVQRPSLTEPPPAAVPFGDDTAPSNPGAPKPDLLIGTTIGGYALEGILGRGAAGIVYRAHHQRDGRRAAFKVLKPQFASDPDHIRRLIEEARALTAIRHSGIVEIYDFGTLPNGQPYLVMELCEGLSLEEQLKFSGRPSLEDVLWMMDELLDALGAAHQCGIIHRDLKPSNIFLASYANGARKKLKVLDFGLARRRVEGQRNPTKPGAMLGTPDYMAPEQVEAKEVGPYSDLYAVGGLAFFLLTGRLPFDMPTAYGVINRKISEPPPRMRTFDPRLSPDLDDLVNQLLARNPQDRPSLRKARAAFAAHRGAKRGPVPMEPLEDRSEAPTIAGAPALESPTAVIAGRTGRESPTVLMADRTVREPPTAPTADRTVREPPTALTADRVDTDLHPPARTDVELVPLASPPTARTLPGAPSLQDSNADGTARELEQLRSALRPSWALRAAIGVGAAGALAALAWYALAR